MLSKKNYKDHILSLSKLEFYKLFHKKFNHAPADFEDKMPFIHVFTYMNANYPSFLNEFIHKLNISIESMKNDFLQNEENTEDDLSEILTSIVPSKEVIKTVKAIKSIKIDKSIDSQNFMKLCNILKINILGKNGHIPALFKYGEIVEINEKFISKLENQLLFALSDPTVFGSTFFDSSSKNRFGFDPAKASTYKEHGLFGFENTIEDEEIQYDTVVEGGAAFIPYKNLAIMIKSNKLENDFMLCFLKDEHKTIISQIVAVFNGINPSDIKSRISITDSSFKQILIPITKDNETEFLSISPIHATQARGIISEKIRAKNNEYFKNQKAKDFIGNNKYIYNTRTLSMAEKAQNFTFQSKAMTGSVLFSLAPSSSDNHLIKFKQWDIIADEVSAAGSDELFRHISSSLWRENKGKFDKYTPASNIKYLIRILDTGFKGRLEKDLLKSFIYKESLRKINFIQETISFNEYFENAEHFAKNAEDIFTNSFIQYLKKFIHAIAPSTNAKRSTIFKDSVFDGLENIIIPAIQNAWINSGIELHEKNMKGSSND